jgi:hypothetical protein
MNTAKIKSRASFMYSSAVVTVLLALHGESHAQGWSSGVRNVKTLGQEVAGMLVYVFFAAGVGAFGWAGKKLWDKGQEGRGDDIKAMHIIWPMIGGAFLMALGWVANTTVETLGGQKTSTTL